MTSDFLPKRWYSESTRKQALALKENKVTVERIAHQIGCNPRTIYKWIESNRKNLENAKDS